MGLFMLTSLRTSRHRPAIGLAFLLMLLMSVFPGATGTAQTAIDADEAALQRQVDDQRWRGDLDKLLAAHKELLTFKEKKHGPDAEPVVQQLNLMVADLWLQRADDALPYAERLFETRLRLAGPTDGNTRLFLSMLGNTLDIVKEKLENEKQYENAALAMKRKIEAAERVYGPNSVELVDALTQLASFEGEKLQRYVDTISLYQRGIAIVTQEHGPEDLRLIRLLRDLAWAHIHRLEKGSTVTGVLRRTFAEGAAGLPITAKGAFDVASALLRRAIAIGEKGLPGTAVLTARCVDTLITLSRRYDKAADLKPLEQMQERLKNSVVEEAAATQRPSDLADASAAKAAFLEAAGRHNEAEEHRLRAVALMEEEHGPDSYQSILPRIRLANLYRLQGRYGEAEVMLRRELDNAERAHGLHNGDVRSALSGLLALYNAQGRAGNAELIARRALAMDEKEFGVDHPDTITALRGLGQALISLRRFSDAEPMLKRTLAISEKKFVNEKFRNVDPMLDLAALYQAQGRLQDAEAQFKSALATAENWAGKDDMLVGRAAHRLGMLYQVQKRFGEAEPLARRTAVIYEKALGDQHPYLARVINFHATVLTAQGRAAEAEPLLQRSLAIQRKMLGQDHPDVMDTQRLLSNCAALRGDWERAVEYARLNAANLERRTLRDSAAGSVVGTISEAEQYSTSFRILANLLTQLPTGGAQSSDAVSREIFVASQWARSSSVAASLAQMASRHAAGNKALATLIRERQDIVGELQAREGRRMRAITAEPMARDRTAEDEISKGTQAVEARLSAIDKQLGAEFPEYDDLVRARPIDLAQAQSLLKPDEVLVSFLYVPAVQSAPHAVLAWVVTPNHAKWYRLNSEPAGVFGLAFWMRCGLDPLIWQNPDNPQAKRCQDGLKTGPKGDVLPFHLQTAYGLYRNLFAQMEDVIVGKHLLIVPDGTLKTIPFSALVTEDPKAGVPVNAEAYRKAKWLGVRQPISMLPSIGSLYALRKFGRSSFAEKPFIGFGNPLLDGEGGNERSPQSTPAALATVSAEAKLAREKQSCGNARAPQVAALRRVRHAVTPLAQSGLADLADLRRQSPLPETADELCSVAKSLGVADSEIYLGARATEKAVKAMSASGQLGQYRIIHFATHGAVAGEVKGRAEPGLILTPPETATEEDDGYLTASEVASLKLNADWVILSACNTAAGGSNGSEALSGLARAFFYAGARSLLVSHWAVESSAAVRLATKAFAELKANPNIGRAEAMRRSMAALIQSGSGLDSHPSYWAPFVLVGEGGK